MNDYIPTGEIRMSIDAGKWLALIDIIIDRSSPEHRARAASYILTNSDMKFSGPMMINPTENHASLLKRELEEYKRSRMDSDTGVGGLPQ